ncbi:SIMPL domain-containing protein [Nocardioides sp. CFH 31398]|uniref:SIMPL domain-containing protein n=1 Tax=Nocardioides sp. CFH 31398 TaxID=2919579 RepID=UPI001F0580BD|nr:SIMPL domain-containing protein [Nocardioides sp. CFH 31398]MCH1868332.1 SIMPL domain-containing protein [Nocardioides sp. CFH 31398]
MPVEITVRGKHELRRRPERATARVLVRVEGSSGAEAAAHLAASAARVADSLRALHDAEAGPVTWWASDAVRTSAHRPHHDKGKQLPLVHQATQGFGAKFSDFARLGGWLTETAQVPGFTVSGVQWALTEVTRDSLVTRTRHEAVLAARAKAQDYADAAGLGPVRLAAVADAGMLGDGLDPSHPGASPMAARTAAAVGPGEELSLVPEDVVLTARVDARFLAD